MDMSSGQSVSAETPQFSDGSTVDIHRAAHSDGDIILASNRPKKRAGRKVFKETRHPVYRGIRRRNKDKWVCELREPNKKSRIWLGTFPTAEMAARAHDVAALALRGTSACLNFADSYWRLPKPASNDAEEIRRVAAKAAKEFRHGHNEDESVQLLQQDIEKSYKHGGVASNNVEHAVGESTFYIDEEAIFDMPGLLSNMAEGLLMSPPKCTLDSEMMTHDDYDDFGHLPLWSFLM